MAKTFQISYEGKRVPHLYIRAFEAFGEAWVVHTMMGGVGYRCSHKETGAALPGTDSETIKAALAAGRSVLDQIGEERIKAMLAEAQRGVAG